MAILDHQVAALYKPFLVEALPERRLDMFEATRGRAPQKPNDGHRRLLRAHRERPRGRCAAKQRDEVAARAHSITSSARSGSAGGMLNPSAREVDHQLVLCRRLNRQLAWLLAAQDAIDVGCRSTPLLDLVGPV